MTTQCIVVFFICCLAFSSSASSREALDKRLRDFNFFWTSRVTEITGAREATKHAVHSTTVELQELLTMVIEELKATDEKENQLEQLNKNLRDNLMSAQNENKEIRETINGMAEDIDHLKKELMEQKDTIDAHGDCKDELKGTKTKIDELEKTIRRMKVEIQISRGGYEMVSGRYVKFYNEKLSWTAAWNLCQNYSSQLITVKDDATTEWIIERNVPIWIGATDAMQEGNWTWSDSQEAIVNGNWNSGEPNNGIVFEENCAAANFKTFPWWSLGKWSDRSCLKEIRFACEIPDFKPAEHDVVKKSTEMKRTDRNANMWETQ